MGILKQKRTSQKQHLIDIREAFNIWDILNSKYFARERLLVCESLVHDNDLKALLKLSERSINKNIQILENEAKKYAVKCPDQRREVASLHDGSKMISDEFMALQQFLFLQEHIENLMRALRTCATNESLRRTIKLMTIRTIAEVDRMVIYLKLKGWIEHPPIFKGQPPKVTEKVSTVEAANLWDQLSYRYDNIRETELFLQLVHDLDFKAFITMGLIKIRQQGDMLEQEVGKLGISMPKKPSIVTGFSQKASESFGDDHTYRQIMIGIQGASMLHAQSFKDSTFNDRIRGIFRRLLEEELDYVDDFIKYGKTKGWLNPMPTYN